MDNESPEHSSTESNIDKSQKIHVSSPNEDDDSNSIKSYYSDSEPENLLSTSMPVQYKLPQRKTSVARSPVKRTLVERMAALYKSVRMKHGTTAHDIIVPLNRNTTTPLISGTFQSNTTATSNNDTTQSNTTTTSNSGTTQCNTTKPLNKGKAQQDMTTQTDNSEPNEKAITASQFYVNPQWMFPTSSLSRTSSNKSKKPIPPPRSRPPAPPYTCPPPYVEPSDMSQTSKYTKRSQYPPYRYPYSSPPYTTQSSSLTYTSRSSSLTYMSQSPAKPYMSQTYIISTQNYNPSYREKLPTLTDSTLSSVPFHTPQSSSLTTTSQTPKTPNTSQMSMRFKRSQSSFTPSYKSKYPTPTDSTLSSVPIHTLQRSSLTNTFQTSTSSLKSQSSTPSPSLPNSTSSGSSQSSAPIHISQPSSSQSHTSQSSASTNDFTYPSVRLTPRSVHYIASPSFSHYSFPRAVHYNTPVSSTYNTVKPQSTENSNSMSACEPIRNVWPTEMGSVVQVSMQNVWEVLANQVHNSLPPSTNVNLQNPSKQSTTNNSDENASLPLTASQKENNKLNVDPKSSDSKTSASKSCDNNTNDYPVVDLLPLYIHGIERKDALEQYIKKELGRAWIYFNKMEVVDIKSIGEIKCICPTINYEDVLKSPLDEKFMTVNMYRQYRANSKSKIY